MTAPQPPGATNTGDHVDPDDQNGHGDLRAKNDVADRIIAQVRESLGTPAGKPVTVHAREVAAELVRLRVDLAETTRIEVKPGDRVRGDAGETFGWIEGELVEDEQINTRGFAAVLVDGQPTPYAVLPHTIERIRPAPAVPAWLAEILHVVQGFTDREHERQVTADARHALAAVPETVAVAAGIRPASQRHAIVRPEEWREQLDAVFDSYSFAPPWPVLHRALCQVIDSWPTVPVSGENSECCSSRAHIGPCSDPHCPMKGAHRA